jgi:Flp pilus assembly pilin Flp
MLKHLLIEFVKDEAGQSIVEYTLLMTLIGATTVFMLTMMGVSIGKMIGVNLTVEDYTSWAYEKFKTK